MEIKSPGSWVGVLHSDPLCYIDTLPFPSRVWMLHCHILQHLIMGMQTVWVMGNASEITHGRSPDLVAGYLNYGGDAYGNVSHSPFVNHHFDS